jgi:hypothetical protein
MKKVSVLLILVLTTVTYAQDAYMELLRSDIKAEKVAVITATMDFTEEESKVFWPIYREYELAVYKLGDQKITLVDDYAENYDKMTDEKADELITKSFKLAEDAANLQKEYYNRLKEVISPITAARFIMVDNRLNMLLDLQIASELPLITK